MKNIITALLSIFITLILIVLGLSISAKNVITETATIIIQEEVTNKIIETTIENNNEINKEEIKEKVNKLLNENPKLKNFINDSFDKLIKVLNDETKITDINLENEIENLIESVTPILSEYGVTLTPEMKNEIMSYVKTDEANNVINKAITEIKTSIPKNVDVMIKTFTNLVSIKFKIFLISLIIIFLLIIAFLKKNYYKWTLNLAIPAIIVGIFYTIFSYLIKTLIETEDIVINMNSIKTYGIINLVLGIILIIIFIILNNIFKNKIVEKTI